MNEAMTIKTDAKISRIRCPRVLQHVMGRDIERKEIFFDDADRSDFIDRLAVSVEEGALDVYAWVLMPHHFHLLCRTRNRPLSASMRKVLTGYVVNFNRRHRLMLMILLESCECSARTSPFVLHERPPLFSKCTGLK